VSDVDHTITRPTEPVILRRSRPDVLVSLIFLITMVAVFVVAPRPLSVVAVIVGALSPVSHVIWEVHRPTTTLHPDGISTRWADVRWETIEQITIVPRRYTWQVSVKQTLNNNPLWLPAPALRRGDGGRAIDEFDAGVAELRRWTASYAPRVTVWQSTGRWLFVLKLRGPLRVIPPMAFGAVLVVFAALYPHLPHR